MSAIDPQQVGQLWARFAKRDAAGEAFLTERFIGSAVVAGIVRFNVGGLQHELLDRLAADGYRLVIPLYATDGELSSFGLVSVSGASDVMLVPEGLPSVDLVMGLPMAARTARRVTLTRGWAETLSCQVAGHTVIGAIDARDVSSLLACVGPVEGREFVLSPGYDAASIHAFSLLEGHLRDGHARIVSMTSASAPEEASKSLSPAEVWSLLIEQTGRGRQELEEIGLEPAITAGFARLHVGNTGHAKADALAKRYPVALPLRDASGGLVSIVFCTSGHAVPSEKFLPGVPVTNAALGETGPARKTRRVCLTLGWRDTLALQLAGETVVGGLTTKHLRECLPILGPLKGREVVLCAPVGDDALNAAFQKLQRELGKPGGPVVRRLTLPEGIADASTWLQQVGAEAFRQAVADQLAVTPLPRRDSAPNQDKARPNVADQHDGSAAFNVYPFPGASNADDDRPAIQITTEQHEVNQQAVAALKRDEALFQRNGMLVQVLRDLAPQGPIQRQPDSPRIVNLAPAIVSDRLSANAKFFKWSKTEYKWVPAHPPAWCVSAVHLRGSWEGIRALEGVTETPVLRPDGSIFQTPGHDPTTRLLFEPTATFPEIPDRPTREDAFAAAKELDEIFCDFPFESEEHRAACFASLLTPFARPAFEGPAPLFVFDANTPATGKSLATDAVSMLFTGRRFARTTNSGTNEEWTKKITAIALTADPMILIDNVTKPLGCESLDAVFTGTVWGERILGKNEKPPLKLNTIWYASGNNVVLTGDLFRRVMHVRFLSTEEHPEERQNFKHPDLLAWIHRERPRLVRAALVILRSYYVAGRPDMGAPRWGSFEEWSRLVPHACLWAGWKDPLVVRGRSDDEGSPALAAFRSLVIGLHEMKIGPAGMLVRDILAKMERERKIAEDKQVATQRPDLWPIPYGLLVSALDELAPPSSPGKPYDAKRVGKQLQKHKNRVVNHDGKLLSIVRGEETKDGSAKWTVREVPAGSQGSQGSVPGTPTRESPP